MLKLLSHWVMCWLELVLALPPSSGTCKALGSPKIPHSCHEHKPTMKSITAERDGQAWALRPTSAESRSSDTVPMGRGWTPVCSFMNVCVLSCKGFHSGPLVPVTFRSTAVLHLLLGNAVVSLAVMEPAVLPWVAIGGSQRPDVCWNHMIWEKSTMHSLGQDMMLAINKYRRWELGLVQESHVFSVGYFKPHNSEQSATWGP